MKIIDGKKIAQKIKREVEREIKRLGSSPALHTILIGGDKVSKSFLSQKERACREVGIKFFCHCFPKAVKTEKVQSLIRKLNLDPKVTGILIQFPLPFQLRSDLSLCYQVSPKKDVDCLTSANFGKFTLENPLFVPPTAQAIDEVLKEEKIKVKGKHTVVVGAGQIAGLPIALSLLNRGTTITVCHEFTKNLKEHTQKADILISATGQPHLIKGFMIKKGAVVIDVGTTLDKGKITGDVDIHSLKGIASKVTPVPGGIGPITVACLLRNVLKAVKSKLFDNKRKV
jgi:methylenetetrahydrofolate dehydrogenase (NADP+)/methenyltetrahydrofolate cyclohydrolase